MGSQGDIVWTPSADWRKTTRIGDFVETVVEPVHELEVGGWDDLWSWSVNRPDEFWTAVWSYFGVTSDTAVETVRSSDEMPGVKWFEGARVNYARHLLEDADPDRTHDDAVAVIGVSQSRPEVTLTFAQLRVEVARARRGLQDLGVGPGDRVAAYLPNVPETVVAFLATASLGAIWAACAPEFGSRSVVDRLGQIEPKVLLVVSGYVFGTKPIDRSADVAEIREGLPTVEHVVHVPYGPGHVPDAVSWNELLGTETAEPGYAPVAFDHPLCVLFSSGTTGKPKAIVHGHGGVLLEHLKSHGFIWDLGPEGRMLWFSTTAWMMWNILVSGLLVRSSIVLIDGNPMYPDTAEQWRLAEKYRVTVMGSSPGFLMGSRREGIRPAHDYDLSSLRQLTVGGSPLSIEGYEWVIAEFGDGVMLNVGCGGTDVCTGFLHGSPLQPVVLGEISGPALGIDAAAFDESGQVVVGELGELVIRAPMPSMPVGFWGDEGDVRYRDTYFSTYPGTWKQGDWVRFSSSGSCVVTGRSDATLNRGGVRLGTAEFYRVVEELPWVEDSLVVHLEDPEGGNGELILYVVLTEGDELDDERRQLIGAELRRALSPRHVPDRVEAVSHVPRNRTGKKLELPVKRLLQGHPLEDVATPGSLADDRALDPYVAHAAARRGVR